MSSRNDDSIDETPAKTPVRRQPHGGALRTGNPHNRGGRPPSKLRAKLRRMADSRLSVLGEISSKKSTASDSDKIRAIDLMLRYGMGDGSVNVADLRACLHEQSLILYERLPEGTADEIIAALRPVWLKLNPR